MGIVVKGGYACHVDIRLTVKKDSVVFSDGRPLYHLGRRLHSRDLIINESNGRPLLTLHPKTVSLHKRWEGYGEGSKPIFSVRKSSMIGKSDLTANVYGNSLAGKFQIEGSFENRRFTVFDAADSTEVAEILLDSGTVTGEEDMYLLYIKAGFDSAFAVALVVILDEIHGDIAVS